MNECKERKIRVSPYISGKNDIRKESGKVSKRSKRHEIFKCAYTLFGQCSKLPVWWYICHHFDLIFMAVEA